jgi:hypothetical protein
LYKNQFKWIKDLNGRSETFKLVKENPGEILQIIGIGKDFMIGPPIAQEIRARIDK